ncbi:hypothetical protein WCLP8_5100005 [uncultured Gammaproteobacteria bacterium]
MPSSLEIGTRKAFGDQGLCPLEPHQGHLAPGPDYLDMLATNMGRLNFNAKGVWVIDRERVG